MSNHFFYQNDHLRTQSSEDHAQTSLRQSSTALAEQCKFGYATVTAMIAVDSMGSVLGRVAANTRQSFIYSPYGYRPLTDHMSPALAFNGERPDRFSGLYLLGNGHRGFSTSLRRFISPDTESPFLEGGLNAYAYCFGNPVNLKDSSGRAPVRPLGPLNRQWQLTPPINRRQVRIMAREARIDARIARQEAIEFQALAERANYVASSTPSSSRRSELMALSRYYEAEAVDSAGAAHSLQIEASNYGALTDSRISQRENLIPQMRTPHSASRSNQAASIPSDSSNAGQMAEYINLQASSARVRGVASPRPR